MLFLQDEIFVCKKALKHDFVLCVISFIAPFRFPQKYNNR